MLTVWIEKQQTSVMAKKLCSNEEHYSTELCGKVLTLDSELWPDF